MTPDEARDYLGLDPKAPAEPDEGFPGITWTVLGILCVIAAVASYLIVRAVLT